MGRYAELCSDPYAQVATMRSSSGADGARPNGGERSGRAKSAHSYSACRNRMIGVRRLIPTHLGVGCCRLVRAHRAKWMKPLK
jgi:hypothetical protein